MRLTAKLLFVSLIVWTIALISPKSLIAEEGNNWINVWLRVDQQEIQNAQRYKIQLKATAIPAGTSAMFTTGWLSVWVDNSGQGFSQVGLITYPDGLHWFAYSLKGMTCIRGTSKWNGLGCIGDVNDLVALNDWRTVELYKATSENYWRARVYNSQGFAFDVGTIPASSNTINFASASFEEGYIIDSGSDPQIVGQYYFYQPQYYSGGTWKTWSYSASDQHNRTDLQRKINGVFEAARFCPHVYGLNPNISGDIWYWYAGTGTAQCVHLFPPIAYDNYNAAVSYTGSWTGNSTCCPNAWKNTLHWSNINGNKATLTTIAGYHPANTITRVYTKAPNRGNFILRKNGTLIDSGSDYAPTKLYQVAETWNANGATTMETTNNNICCDYTDVDAYLIDIPKVGDGSYDNYKYPIRYLGAWTHRSQGVDSASDKTLSWTNVAENAISFTFEGNKIKYTFTKHWNRGIARITIDGTDYGTVDACSATTQWQQSVTFPSSGNLPAGVHTLHIANTGQTTCTTNPSCATISNCMYIDVDTLEVLP